MTCSNCCYALFLKLIEAIKNIKAECKCNIPQPLEISGSISINTSSDNPIYISSIDPCIEAIKFILSSSSSFSRITFTNGEQFQSVTNVIVSDTQVSFISNNKTIMAPLCSIEYVISK